ncbi:claspin-like isoform X2 [Macrosteles quadrilineatus]|uniref:claspin-like isoform X2 n=1 Tax=Macrosteles quadrilineatus TaxID=74068 RepID=UPI0023E259E1|nr:claspin-like isoform X2 [Macrosteles quadrilineatus]
MASTMSENGDTSEEILQQNSETRVNGEVNGSYDEPMDVDETVKTVKKISSNDINCISDVAEKDSDSLNEPNDRINSNCEDELSESAVENEVPEKDEGTSSNGFDEHQDQEKEENNVEENHEDEEETNQGEEDDIMMVEEEDAGDPLGNESSAGEVENIEKETLDESEDKTLDDQDNTSSPEKQIDSSENEKNENQENENVEASLEKSDKEAELKDSSNKDHSVEESQTAESEKEEKDKGEGEKMEVDGEKNEESPDKTKTEEDSEKTPDKGKKKKTPQQPINITPRRSSRNVNKPKTYIDEPDIKGTTLTTPKKINDDPDIEEIVPQDPLAMDSPVSDKKKKTVVVSDPKRLVEIATGSKQTKLGKKEPTLVIIDTNSILSGRGPVPVSPSSPLGHSTTVAGSSRGQGYSVLPVALPAQGMYPHPLKQTQLKPLSMSHSPSATPSPPPATSKTPPVILPSLTDDMYVVEAPSFIVPYVYEKPPIKPLKNFVDQVEQAIKEIKAQLEKEKNEEDKKAEEEKKSEEEEEDKKSDSSEKDDKEKSKDDDAKDEKMEVDAEATKTKDDDSKEKDETKDSEKSEDKSSESKESEKSGEDGKADEEKSKKSSSYFDNPLGKFFIQIGVNLVQEHVQTDLLRSQKRKKEREGSKCTPEVQQAMNSLIRSLEFSKATNEPFKLEMKKCEFCSFKTESALVMAHHLETPHMRNYVYRCNFCPLEVRSPHDILYHMEAEHNVRGRLERAPAFHQCPSCPFEDNQKGKLSRHLLSCAKKYRPERNQEPPLDFEPPAKIPRVSRNRPSMSPGNAVYQAAMSGLKQGGQGHPLLPKLVPAPSPPGLIRGRGRPQMINRYLGDMRTSSVLAAQQKAMAASMRPGMLYRPSGSNSQPQVLLPASYQLANSQLYQDQMSLYQQMVTNHRGGLSIGPPPLSLPQNVAASVASKTSVTPVGASTAKLLQQPSISITPLPRQQQPPPSPAPAPPPANKPGRPAGSSKATFVICEICDGYIKDLEQLRNHMQWIHKVKIHPKMIYNRPPLNCQKCQFRFFTDQGLERHLLGSHGLVTSSMQEAANKGKDGGRCPVCGRVYQWKLLNHVARDHNMSLKPAHLSYKCTVCTATFGMYKQFENHVYSAHSVVAKRVMDKKPSSSSQPSTSSQGDMLKPLKINDEITIIPQPARSKTKPAGSNNRPQKKV